LRASSLELRARARARAKKNPGAACRELARRQSSLSRPSSPRLASVSSPSFSSLSPLRAGALPAGGKGTKRPHWLFTYLPGRSYTLYPVYGIPKKTTSPVQRGARGAHCTAGTGGGAAAPPVSRFPRDSSRSYQECGYLSGCSVDFFPPTDCPAVDLSVTQLLRLHRSALYPSVVRMLPTRLNGRAQCVLVRDYYASLLLLALRSWHSLT